MKTNNYLVIVNNLSDVENIKKVENATFLFPLKGYSIGFENSFSLSEIKEENAYIFINRLIPSEEIEELKNILNNLPENIKGIVFDDLGVLEIVKDLNIEKILYLSHFGTNYESINAFLEYVDSMVISTDITKEEIIEILDKVSKKLVLHGFGYVPVMYSRRTLLTNFNKHFNLEYRNTANIEDKFVGNKFKVIESEFGTVLYHHVPSNALEIVHDNIGYYLINTMFLNSEEINELFSNIKNNEPIKIEHDRGFLDKPTIYKLKDGD